MTKAPTPRRPRGRPVTGRPRKRHITLRLAADVAEYLDTVENKAETVEAAVRATEGFKNKKEGGDRCPG